MGRISESISEHKYLTAGLVIGGLVLGNQYGLYEGEAQERASAQFSRMAQIVIDGSHKRTETRYGVEAWDTVAFDNQTGAVLFEETFEGPDAAPYAAEKLNDTHDKWYVEHLEDTAFDRAGGV